MVQEVLERPAAEREVVPAFRMEMYTEVEKLYSDLQWRSYGSVKLVCNPLPGQSITLEMFDEQVIEWLRGSVSLPGIYRVGGCEGAPAFELSTDDWGEYRWRRLF